MGRTWKRLGLNWVVVILACALGITASEAQTKTSDGDSEDWCYSQASINRIENRSVTLSCGTCEGLVNQACFVDSDCPIDVPCVGSSNSEIVWWDDRADAAVNDLATVAVAQDESNLYLAVELWTYPDPVSLPFIQIAIDFEPGGADELWDPGSEIPPTPPDQVKAPGTCSVFTDRGCTRDEDCHFCLDSFEAPDCCDLGSCPPETLCRVRTCGSECNIGDICNTSQTCEGLGAVPVNGIGSFSVPMQQADLLFLYDLSVWLLGGGTVPSVELKEWDGSGWANVPSSCSVTEEACASDDDCPPVGGGPQQCVTRFFWGIAPCGPCPTWPPLIELVVPWSTFGCTGCPEACSCPGFGPGQALTFTAAIARGEHFLDFVPRGEMEDVMSEAVAGTSTATTNDCPGSGIGTTLCEIDDGSSDAFVPGGICHPGPAGAGDVPDGHTVAGSPLRVESVAGDEFRISWSPSCSACDTDYAVYVRDLDDGPGGDWQPWLCSSGGSTMTTFNPDGVPLRAGFVAVPLNGGGGVPVEGGLGFESDGTRRSASSTPCAESAISTCDGVSGTP